MNPEKRRLVLKSLVEFCVVFRRMLALRRQDILLVTCVLPTSLILIEWANRLLRRRGVHVVLHGDIEGILHRPGRVGCRSLLGQKLAAASSTP